MRLILLLLLLVPGLAICPLLVLRIILISRLLILRLILLLVLLLSLSAGTVVLTLLFPLVLFSFALGISFVDLAAPLLATLHSPVISTPGELRGSGWRRERLKK